MRRRIFALALAFTVFASMFGSIPTTAEAAHTHQFILISAGSQVIQIPHDFIGRDANGDQVYMHCAAYETHWSYYYKCACGEVKASTFVNVNHPNSQCNY